MEKKLICFDTSIFIDHFRKKDKANTKLSLLTDQHNDFFVSIVTVFEIYVGVKKGNQIIFWNNLLAHYKIIEFREKENHQAIKIYKNLKSRNRMIESPDIFIAATAIANNLKFATLNQEQFGRIEGLYLHNFN